MGHHRYFHPPVILTWTAALAVVSMALSISATHTFAYLTMVLFGIFWIGSKVRRSAIPILPDSPSLPGPLFAAGLLFAWVLLSSGARILASGEPAAGWRTAIRAEWNDIPLFLFGLLVFRLCAEDRYARILRGAIIVFCAIVLLSGAAALFSEFRLAKIFMGHNHVVSADNRPQHPFLAFGQMTIFRPIGFMNTRLTFAGLLVLILPFLGASALSAFSRWITADRSVRAETKFGPAAAAFISVGAFVLGAGILAVNGTRSALFGAVDSLAALLVFSLPRRFQKMVFAAGLVCAAGAALFAAVEPHSLARFLRHTDFQRPIIWTGSADIAADHPWIGTGAGGFTNATLAWRQAYVRENPDTWYFVECSPRGHAHNDLLHLAAVAGVPGAALFLTLLALTGASAARIYAQVKPAGEKNDRAESSSRDHEPGAFLLGACGLFLAGTAQCYFQDDEVVIVLWTIVAYAMARAAKNSRPYISPPDSNR